MTHTGTHCKMLNYEILVLRLTFVKVLVRVTHGLMYKTFQIIPNKYFTVCPYSKLR